MPAKKKVAKEDVGKVAKMRAVQRNPGQEVRKKMVVENDVGKPAKTKSGSASSNQQAAGKASVPELKELDW